MLVVGMVAGLLTGGPPGEYATPVAQVGLFAAMTLALGQIQFAGVRLKDEARAFGRALVANYVILTAGILLLGWIQRDTTWWPGWVVMASAPSAIAVVPASRALRGDVRSAAISTALLYASALVLMPIVTLAFAGRSMDVGALVVQTLLLVALPVAFIPVCNRLPISDDQRTVAVNVAFAVLVFSITGPNRLVFLEAPAAVAVAVGISVVRTFGIGLALLRASPRSLNDGERRNVVLFGSFKNLGLSALLAFAAFGPAAAVPSIIALFLEIGWLAALPAAMDAWGRGR